VKLENESALWSSSYKLPKMAEMGGYDFENSVKAAYACHLKDLNSDLDCCS
jgi:hypothetical protein